MKKITALAWKDVVILFSSRSQLLFFLILPILFTFLLGGGFSGDDEVESIPLLAVNEDGSALADQLLAAVGEGETVRIEKLGLTEAEEAFADEEAPALLIIPAGFEASLMRGEPVQLEMRKAPNNLEAEALDQEVAAATVAISRALVVAGTSVNEAAQIRAFDSDESRQAYFAQSMSAAQEQFATAPKRVETARPQEAGEEEGIDVTAHHSAGQLLTWVFIPLLGTSALLAFERTRGTLSRLVISPTRKETYLLGTISGQFGLAIVQMILLIIFGVLVMKVDWGQSIPGLAVMLVAFGLASVALGVMFGTFFKTESQANNLSIGLGMAMVLLAGAWWPMELFPPTAQTVVQILPTTWAMRGLSDLVLRGQGLSGIMPEAAVLLGFALVFFVVGVRRFRYE